MSKHIVLAALASLTVAYASLAVPSTAMGQSSSYAPKKGGDAEDQQQDRDSSQQDEGVAKSSASASSDGSRLSVGRYVAGGIVGSFLGFGIGHAIVGEYGSIGWLFTVLEVACVAAMIGGIAILLDQTWETGAGGGTAGAGGGLLYVGGAVGLVGVHVWESIDVWIRPVDRLGSDQQAALRDIQPSHVAEPAGGLVGITIRF